MMNRLTISSCCWLLLLLLNTVWLQAQTDLPYNQTTTINTLTSDDFRVPEGPGTLTIEVKGADGGHARLDGGTCDVRVRGGEGATMKATFVLGNSASELRPGGLLRVFAGRAGQTDESGCAPAPVGRYGAGGGSSAILYQPPGWTEWELLAVAGGGGGGARTVAGVTDRTGYGGQAMEDGSNTSGSSGGTDGSCGQIVNNGYGGAGVLCEGSDEVGYNMAKSVAAGFGRYFLTLEDNSFATETGGKTGIQPIGGDGFTGGAVGAGGGGGGGGFSGGAGNSGWQGGGGGSFVTPAFSPIDIMRTAGTRGGATDSPSQGFVRLTTSLTCPVGDVVLNSQQAINDFASTYPNCTEIAGNLTIAGIDIVDVSPLSNITAVQGNVNFNNCIALRSLAGLSNLQAIGGELVIVFNDVLTDLDGLSSLTSVGSSVRILGNFSLRNVNGLSNLSTIGGNLEIGGNPSLTNFDGVCPVITSGGITGNISIESNGASFSTADCSCPAGEIQLNSQADVNNFPINYPYCTTIPGQLVISGPDITDLSPLANVVSVSGDLIVGFNAILPSLQGLSNLQSVGGNLTVGINPALPNLDGLANVANVGGDLTISSNGMLTDFRGICPLISTGTVGGTQTFTNNAADFAIGECFCPTGEIQLNSQADVNNFPLSYPNCTQIPGQLVISGPDITDLSPLANITSIGGYLIIGFNATLADLQGLSNLQSVGGNLTVGLNPALPNLNGLSNLSNVGGDLIVTNNGLLSDYSGICPLISTGVIGGTQTFVNNAAEFVAGDCFCPAGDVVLTSQAAVNDFAATYPNCRNLPGSLTIRGRTITDLSPLAQLETIQGDLVINDVLSQVFAFASLVSIGGDLDIIDNDFIPILDDLSNLKTIGGDFDFRDNVDDIGSDVVSFEGLNSLESIGGALFILNSGMKNIIGFQNLNSIGGRTRISNNPNLETINAFGQLRGEGGEDLSITGNPVLSTISPLSGLSQLGEVIIKDTQLPDLQAFLSLESARFLSISNNSAISDLTGLENLKSVQGIGITRNNQLVNIDALSNITTLGSANSDDAGLIIHSNPLLTNLNALSGLRGTVGNVRIDNSAALVDIDALSNLTAITGQLSIQLNPNLVHLDGLRGLTSVGDDISIKANTVLSNFEGICPLISEGTIGGTLTVVDNGAEFDSAVDCACFADSTPPVAQCKDIIVSLDANGQATVLPTDLDDGSFDDCGEVVIGFPNGVQQLDFSCDDVFTASIVIVEVTNAKGLSSTCFSEIGITEDIAPVVSCKDITVELNTNGLGFYSADMLDDGVVDNCELGQNSYPVLPVTCNEVGTFPVTYTVRDKAGNEGSCTGNVTVVESNPTAPTAQCQNVEVILDANGQASVTPSDIDNGSFDDCGPLSFSFTNDIQQLDFTCADVNTFSILIMEVTDNSGLSSTCTGEVVIKDDIAPVVSCKDITVELNANGLGFYSADMLDDGVVDNCELGQNSYPVLPVTCNEVGTFPVTYTVRDKAGNEGSCTGNVTVVEGTPTAPTAQCQNVEVILDANGQGSVTPSDIDNGSFDDCGPLSFSFTNDIQQLDFTCADVNTFSIVIMEVTDNSGLSSTCTGEVVIKDDIAPVVSCKDITVELNANGLGFYSADMLDDGVVDNCELGQNSYPELPVSCNEIGTFPVTYTVRDKAGNEGSCTGNVTVVEGTPTAPTAQCQNVEVMLDANGQGSVTPADIDNGSFDNCGSLSFSFTNDIQQLDFTCADVNTFSLVILEVTDNSGLSSTCVSEVVIKEDIAPVVSCKDITVELDANGLGFYSADMLDDGVVDNCELGQNSYPELPVSCNEIGTFPVTYTVRDKAGNEGACTGNVTVIEKVAPVALCQDLEVTLDEAGQASIIPTDLDNGSSDNCGTLDFIADQTSFTAAQFGENTVTLTATDASGNSSSCTSTVTVEAGIVLIAYVWDDQDGDGKQDAYEPALAEASVELIDHATGAVLQQAQTNVGGEATFDVSGIGATQRVKLKFYEKANHRFTLKDKGSNDNIDSDASRSNGLTAAFTLDADGKTEKWDCGLWAPGTIQSFVWDDQDGDGKQDNGEPGFSGAQVDLLESDGTLLATTTTDENGLASFSQVPADRPVKLKFYTLPNLSFTLKDRGSNNNIDSDASRTNGMTATFQANKGSQSFESWDAGMWSTGTVQAYVWDDQDGDGKQDGGEPAIAGVRVDLLESDGAFIETAQTDASGIATFTGIPTNRPVKLQFFEKDDHRFTLKDRGSNDNIDSDASRTNGMTATFQPSMGNQTIQKWDAGLWSPGQVKAYVWDDQDGDGKQDASEPAIAGAKVDLLESDGELMATAQTDASGYVTFTGIPADRPVKLQFFEKDDHRFTLKDQGSNNNIDSDASRSNGMTATFQASKGNQTTESWDAGLWSPGQVEAFVWDDRDGDGKQDAGEPGIKGVSVHLLESDGTLVQTGTTGDGGLVNFDNVAANRPFKLQFFTLPGFDFTLKDQGSNNNIDSDASRSNGMTATFQASTGNQTFQSWDAGLWSPGTVEAYVWDDLDGDGKQDEGEPAIANAQVDLLESDGALMQTTTTDQNGLATFSGVPADRAVKLQFFEPIDHRFTLKDKGSNDNIDSDASRSNGMTGTFQASQGAQVHTKMDCGLWSPGEVEAYVWNDLDGDGKQDEGEPGIEGVFVDLLESNNDLLVSTATDADGIATILDLPANRAVKLQFTAPAGYSITLKDKGSNDNIDSDASRSNGRTATFQATMGQQLFVKWDAGLVEEGTSGARVVQEQLETPTAPVAVEEDLELEGAGLSLTAFPNPFSGQLTLEFYTSKAGPARIDVFNLQGQLVRNLFNGQLDAGQHQLQRWDGTGANAKPLPAGMYLIQMKTGEEIVNQKVLLQR